MRKTTTKQGVSNNKGVDNRPVPLEHVLACLETEECLERARSYWEQHGIKPSESWGQRSTKEIVCDSLTRVEDWMEYERPRATKTRDRIKAVRRRLEWLLWP